MKTKNVLEILWLRKEETRQLIKAVNHALRLANWAYELTKVVFLLTVGYNIGQIATIPGDVSSASIYGYGSAHALWIAAAVFLGALMYRDNLAWYKYHLTEHLDDIKNIAWA